MVLGLVNYAHGKSANLHRGAAVAPRIAAERRFGQAVKRPPGRQKKIWYIFLEEYHSLSRKKKVWGHLEHFWSPRPYASADNFVVNG